MLAACQALDSIPERPVDTASVQFGNAGSIVGGGLITEVYPNDQAYRWYRGTRAGDDRTEWYQLPAGSFDQVKALALAQFPQLPATQDAPVCMDAGEDILIVVDAAANRRAYQNTCPTDAARAAFSDLRAEVTRQIAVAKDQGL